MWNFVEPWMVSVASCRDPCTVITSACFAIRFGHSADVRKLAIGSKIAVIALKSPANSFPLTLGPCFRNPSRTRLRRSLPVWTFLVLSTSFWSLLIIVGQSRGRFWHLQTRLEHRRHIWPLNSELMKCIIEAPTLIHAKILNEMPQMFI